MRTIKEMLNELIDRGWSQSALARHLNTNQPTIHRLAIVGKEPGYLLGKKIEELYLNELATKDCKAA